MAHRVNRTSHDLVECRVLRRALSRLEPCAVKVASTVLRGRGGGNATPLPDSSHSRREWRSPSSCVAASSWRSRSRSGATGATKAVAKERVRPAAGFATSSLRRSCSGFATPFAEWLDDVSDALCLLPRRLRALAPRPPEQPAPRLPGLHAFASLSMTRIAG